MFYLLKNDLVQNVTFHIEKSKPIGLKKFLNPFLKNDSNCANFSGRYWMNEKKTWPGLQNSTQKILLVWDFEKNSKKTENYISTIEALPLPTPKRFWFFSPGKNNSDIISVNKKLIIMTTTTMTILDCFRQNTIHSK